jgi:ABC-type oligopeptide transport system substrate-binding subunit
MPLPEIDRILADPQLSQEFYSAPQACTYYYGFVHTKPPMDDARVRQAFAQSIDRQALIDNVLKSARSQPPALRLRASLAPLNRAPLVCNTIRKRLQLRCRNTWTRMA